MGSALELAKSAMAGLSTALLANSGILARTGADKLAQSADARRERRSSIREPFIREANPVGPAYPAQSCISLSIAGAPTSWIGKDKVQQLCGWQKAAPRCE